MAKIDVPSTWDMDEDFGWNVSDGPDAAVGVKIVKTPLSFGVKLEFPPRELYTFGS